MPTPRAPDVFSLCHLQSFQLFGFPPRTKFFHFVQNSGAEFQDNDCERWKRHSSSPKFPPQKVFSYTEKNELPPSRRKSTRRFLFDTAKNLVGDVQLNTLGGW